jgi:hypothetical protein
VLALADVGDDPVDPERGVPPCATGWPLSSTQRSTPSASMMRYSIS